MRDTHLIIVPKGSKRQKQHIEVEVSPSSIKSIGIDPGTRVLDVIQTVITTLNDEEKHEDYYLATITKTDYKTDTIKYLDSKKRVSDYPVDKVHSSPSPLYFLKYRVRLLSDSSPSLVNLR